MAEVEIELDATSSIPLHQQIHDRIVEAIARGDLGQGDVLASVRGLSGAFGINPATVVKAYRSLMEEGLAGSRPRSGTIVSRDRTCGHPGEEFEAVWRPRLVTVLAEARAQGMTADEIVDACRRVAESF
jgi:DNA-binding transcriptional regulator YhcF (GntR family)